MAHFRGVIQGARGEKSAVGHKSSGLRVEAQSWEGKVVVTLCHIEESGKDWATVRLDYHNGQGVIQQIYSGPVGGKG